MKNLKPVVTVCDYGKIKIKLSDILEEKGISRNQLSKLTDTRFEVVNKWYTGDVERIDADVLARFCYALGCDVSDIIKYEI